jgi:hypothetical protein
MGGRREIICFYHENEKNNTILLRRTIMTNSLSLKDVARLLKVKPYRITYALVVGLVPEPDVRINNKRIFVQEDLERLAAHFGITLKA